MLLKICSKYKNELELNYFYPDKRKKDNKQSWCKMCSREWHHNHKDYIKEKNKKYKEKNPTYHNDWQRKSKYGITPIEVEKIRKKQKYICIGCLKKLNSIKECVDHNHTTKKIRGLLCNDCNLVIGFSKDDINILKRLTKYLTRQEAEQY